MKKKPSKWNESYVETFRHTRLVTQIFSFSVALVLILNFLNSIYNISALNEVSLEIRQAVLKELFIQIFVALLFGVRFLLLFSKIKIYFWFSQFVWLFTYLMLLSQLSLSEFSGCTKNAFPVFGENFSYIFVAYLIASPIRQFATLIYSFVKVKGSKI